MVSISVFGRAVSDVHESGTATDVPRGHFIIESQDPGSWPLRYSVTVFGNLVERAVREIKIGTPVFCSGRLSCGGPQKRVSIALSGSKFCGRSLPMSMPKTPLELLLATLADFEEHADRAERKATVPALKRLAKKLEIQSLELSEQRLRLTYAESIRDLETLRDLALSQHAEIREWSAEILNLKRQPRTLPFQNIQL